MEMLLSQDPSQTPPECNPETWRQEIREDGSVYYEDGETGEFCAELGPPQQTVREPEAAAEPEPVVEPEAVEAAPVAPVVPTTNEIIEPTTTTVEPTTTTLAPIEINSTGFKVSVPYLDRELIAETSQVSVGNKLENDATVIDPVVGLGLVGALAMSSAVAWKRHLSRR